MPTPSLSSLTAEDKKIYAALSVILAIAAVIRLAHLDALSLWFDEAIVPVMASKPLGYLLNWVNTKEMHPPLYHLLIKGVLFMGSSDFALRLPSALLGLAGITLMYKVGAQWVDRRTGLFSALFLCFNPAHVYISRVVRPYSLASFFLLVGLLLLHRFLTRKDHRALYWLALSQGLMLSVVYTALIPILFFQVVCAVVLIREHGLKPSLKPLVVNAILTLAPAGYFLAHCMYQRHGNAWSNSTGGVLANFLKAASGILSAQLPETGHGASLPWYFWTCVVLMVLGLIRLGLYHRRTFWLCLAFGGAALAFVIAVRSAFSFTYWHLFALYPFVALLAGAGLAAPLLRDNRGPVAVLILAGFWLPFFIHTSQGFYNDLSGKATFRLMGKAIAGLEAPGQGIFMDSSYVDLVNWYADRFSLVNRLREQSIRAEGEPVTLHVFERVGDAQGLLMPREGEKGQPTARLVHSQSLEDMALETWQIDNPGSISMRTPMNLTLGAQARDFYGRVSATNRVMLRPYWGYSVIPSLNDAWTSFEYHFTNRSQVKDLLIALETRYKTKAVGIMSS